MKCVLPLFLVLCILPACSPREESPLPDRILHLERTEVISGDAAAEIINHLHQKEVTPAVNYVGRYRGEGYSATYYLSLYDSSDEARAELDAMVASMEMGGHVFDHIRKRNVKGHDVWMALGMGQAHYFFAENNRLVWLAIDVPVAEDAIESLF